MAFAFLETLVLDHEEDNDNESDIDVDPLDIGEDSADDSETEEPDDRGDATDVGWSDELSSVNERIAPFLEPTGPLHDLPTDSEPLDYFKLFLSDEMIDLMVVETNRYAAQDAERKQKEDAYWKPVDRADICNYLAINITFGLHKLPETKLYWSSDLFWRVPAVADLMGRVRYIKINQFFHLNNSALQPARGADHYDPLFKVRPLLDHVRHQCQTVYKPGRKISVDEAMVGFTGRLGFKQYIKNKPTSWGIKLWCCADTKTGYVMNFQCYTGKSEQPSQHGQGYDVVMNMTGPYLDKHHIVYFDKIFSSPILATDLLQRNTYCCGTIRPNRKGWPYPKQKAAKGTVIMCQKGLMVATQGTDKRQVNILSTSSNPEMCTATRRTKAGPTVVNIPVPVMDYNSGMFGVDLSDQHRSYYKVGQAGHKWWRYLTWYLVQVSIINSYILTHASNPNAPRGSPSSSHLSFRTAIAKALMCNESKKKVQESPSVSGQAKAHSSSHHVSSMPGRKRRCFQCAADGNKTGSGRTRETVTGCILCKAHLHGGVCYAKFHENLKH